jgi:indole-3-glycerol phosphate synthase
MTILEKIINSKIEEVKVLKNLYSIKDFEKRSLFQRKTESLKTRLELSHHGIIAEHKRKSPSKSIINNDIKLEEVILGYDTANVSGISVLTDKKYFGGNTNDLLKARELTKIPIIRKEFIIDEFQILEAKAFGADVILLIAACLNEKQIKNLSEFAKSLNLEVLIEIHNNQELEKCLLNSIDIIGVNNRNLKTFEVDIENSINLSEIIPENFVKISESGISSAKEISILRKHGFKGFLIGETFMRKKDPGKEVLKMINEIR